jgi:hypothetical protein
MSYMAEASSKLNISSATTNALKDFIWMVIADHKDDEFTLKVWFFRKTFKIGDLYSVFELVLGPPPITV